MTIPVDISTITLFSISLCPTTPLRPSVNSTALSTLYSPLSPQRLSVPYMALCPIYGPPSPLRTSVQLLWPSVPSIAIIPLYGPLSLLRNMFFLIVSWKDDDVLLYREASGEGNGQFSETAKRTLLFLDMAKSGSSKTQFRLQYPATMCTPVVGRDLPSFLI
jgi:hypothetical protein